MFKYSTLSFFYKLTPIIPFHLQGGRRTKSTKPYQAVKALESQDDDDEDLKGEGETEDTQLVKNGFTYFSLGPKDVVAAQLKAEEER